MDIAKITALTGAQARQLGKYAKECLALGLCRDPIDEAAAEKYGKSLVNWLECDAYLGTIVVDSPLAAYRTAHVLSIIDRRLWRQVLYRKWDKFRDEELAHERERYDRNSANDYVDRFMKRLRRDRFFDPVTDNSPFMICAATYMQSHLEKTMTDGEMRILPRHSRNCKPDWIQGEDWGKANEQVWDRLAGEVTKEDWDGTYSSTCLFDDQIRRVMNLIEGLGADNPFWRQNWAQIEKRLSAASNILARIENTVMYAALRNTCGSFLDIPIPLKGQFLSHQAGHIRFMREILRLDLRRVWEIEDQASFGCVIPVGGFVVISRRPESIHVNSSMRLHGDGCPAIRYPDGFSIYALNGVEVPDWLAVMDSGEMDPREFTIIENAEVRREFVRKVGVERIMHACKAVSMEAQGGDELFSVSMERTAEKRPHLKIADPSTGTWHLEPVAKDAATVDQALRWLRHHSDLSPERLLRMMGIRKVRTLDKAQRESLSRYAQAGVEQALCCDPLDESAARDYARRLMKELGREYRAAIIAGSPMTAFRMCWMLRYLELEQTSVKRNYRGVRDCSLAWSREWREINAQVSIERPEPSRPEMGGRRRHVGRAAIRTRIFKSVDGMHTHHGVESIGVVASHFEKALRRTEDWLDVQMDERIYEYVEKHILDAIYNQIAPIHEMIGEQCSEEMHADVSTDRYIASFDSLTLAGQWITPRVASYDYCNYVLRLDLPDCRIFRDQVHFGGVFPLATYVVISRRPECIRLNSSGLPHCDGGPAIRYPDGWAVYALNGTRVPEWLAVARGDELDPAEFARIENVEIRREFVRKAGIERIARACGAVSIDKRGDYELISMNLGGRTGKWPYLKMLNPSTGAWHLEAVAREMTTVEQALHWRNQSDSAPEQLT